jgi:hypothetical protein
MSTAGTPPKPAASPSIDQHQPRTEPAHLPSDFITQWWLTSYACVHVMSIIGSSLPTSSPSLLSSSSQDGSSFSTLMSSPLASTHAKFPLPGSPGYIKPYVFLGGSCDPTTWRADIAVPELTRARISFFNPQISDWHPNLIQLEAKAKEVCEVLLFVIDSKTRAIASMLESIEYILSQRRVVIVILDIPEGARIDGDIIEGRQLKDLNRARAFLCDIAARHQKYCDVFDSIERVSDDTMRIRSAWSGRSRRSCGINTSDVFASFPHFSCPGRESHRPHSSIAQQGTLTDSRCSSRSLLCCSPTMAMVHYLLHSPCPSLAATSSLGTRLDQFTARAVAISNLRFECSRLLEHFFQSLPLSTAPLIALWPCESTLAFLFLPAPSKHMLHTASVFIRINEASRSQSYKIETDATHEPIELRTRQHILHV